jgi:integrase
MAKAKKREDGRYAVSLTLANGKRKYFYSTTSRHEAELKKAEWVKQHPDLMEGEKLDGRITVEKWAEKWMDAYKGSLEPSSRRWYSSTVKSICGYTFKSGVVFGSMRVTEVRAAHLSEIVNSFSGIGKGTIQNRKMVLRSLFSAAKDNGIISVDPAVKLPNVKGTYEGHKALTRHEAQLIADNYQGHRFGLPAMLMMWGGFRKQEAFSLHWSDVDLKDGFFHVTHAMDVRTGREKATKTENSVRDIPIFAALKLPLQRAYKGRTGELVFPREDGSLWSEQAIKSGLDSFIKYIKERTGEELDFTCHDLRDTFATMCYDAGVDVQTTAKWMGHSNVMTTLKIYTKLSAEKHEESIERMNGFISEAL